MRVNIKGPQIAAQSLISSFKQQLPALPAPISTLSFLLFLSLLTRSPKTYIPTDISEMQFQSRLAIFLPLLATLAVAAPVAGLPSLNQVNHQANLLTVP